MKKNSLNIKNIAIFNTREFFNKFLGKNLIIWIDNRNLFFSLSKLTDYKFDFNTNPGTFVMLGLENEGFGISFDAGFGFKVEGESEKYYIDKMNENEVVVITYLKGD